MKQKTVSQMIVDGIAGNPEEREKSAKAHSHFVQPTTPTTTQSKAKKPNEYLAQLAKAFGVENFDELFSSSSFDDLDAARAAADEGERIASLSQDLQNIIASILRDDSISDKAQAIRRASEDFATRAEKPKPAKKSKVKAAAHSGGMPQDAVSLLFGPGAIKPSLKSKWQIEAEQAEAEGERAHEDWLKSMLSRGMIR